MPPDGEASIGDGAYFCQGLIDCKGNLRTFLTKFIFSTNNKTTLIKTTTRTAINLQVKN
jgi:hypothetical protein